MRVTLPGVDAPINELSRRGTPELSAHNQTSAWAAGYRETTITPREREAWRQRLAHLEGCEHCATLRSGSHLTETPLPDAFYDNIFNSNWSGYTEREQLIIELIERLADDHEELRDDDAFWAKMHQNFTDTEIVDLTYHMIGPQLFRAFMAKVLLGFTEFCEVRPGREAAQQGSVA
jgi:alkylhydroperoxidase family enzyme